MNNKFEPISDEVEGIVSRILDGAFQVHRNLGPGLLESVYQVCLCYELRKMGLEYKSELALPVVYEEIKLDAGLRLDILVCDSVIIELKAVEKVLPVHEAQLMTYLKLSGKRLGLLINFNVPLLKDGIRRFVM